MWLKLSGPVSLSFAKLLMLENDFGFVLLLLPLVFGSLHSAPSGDRPGSAD